MSTILNGSTFDCPPEASEDFKVIVHSLKQTLTASECFIKFIQLSTSHESTMENNLPTIQSVLIQIILKLLSSFKFKFTSLIDCNGLGQRPGFIEMVNQMEKYKMHDYHYWSLIIEETRQGLDKFCSVNKAKYEDLIKFIQLSLDHITRHNIFLDLQSFAVLFNTVVASQPEMGLQTILDFTPLSSLPTRVPNQVSVIRTANCPSPLRSPVTIHSKTCFSTHRRRLNFDALEDEPDDTSTKSSVSIASTSSYVNNEPVEYKLIPITFTDHKIYQRPDNYKLTPHSSKTPLPMPLDPFDPAQVDPRASYRKVILPVSVKAITTYNKNKRAIRTLLPNGKITIALTNDQITSPDPVENPVPAKRQKIHFDL